MVYIPDGNYDGALGMDGELEESQKQLLSALRDESLKDELRLQKLQYSKTLAKNFKPPKKEKKTKFNKENDLSTIDRMLNTEEKDRDDLPEKNFHQLKGTSNDIDEMYKEFGLHLKQAKTQNILLDGPNTAKNNLTKQPISLGSGVDDVSDRS